MTRKDLLALIGFYLPCLVVQGVGGAITATSVSNWYQDIAKSTLTPPGYWFGIVWTILYILMAIAAWRVWRVERTVRSEAQLLWIGQLVTGLLWTTTFFGMKQMHEGLAIIACLWLLIACTLRRFYKIDRLAGRLLVPLLLWVSFATYLQAMIVTLN